MTTLIRFLKNKYLPFLFAIPLFFCVFRYDGIIIDAVLYVTQYVYSIDPSRFLGDPAFEFGNQDSLGLFSPVFGVFIECFGVSYGAFVYTVIMQFAWVISAVLLIRMLLCVTSQRLWVLPVTILFVVFFANGMSFSHISFFKYVSTYACSRSLSIALAMGAVALIFNQRKISSLLLIIAGTVVHPITAGWCLPFWMFYFFPKTRAPIVVFSFFFPLSFLFHVGVFDKFPTDWLSRPLDFRPKYVIISRYLLLLIFFGTLARHSANLQKKKISNAMWIIVAIAAYWDMWGGYGEHILLYQSQPWRAIWLPSVVAVPLGLCQVKDVVRRLQKNKRITTHDFAMILLILSFLLPQNVLTLSILSASLLLRRKKDLSLGILSWIFVVIIFAGYLVQQYHTWCLQGFSPFFGYNYQEIYRVRDSFLICQFFFAIAFIGIYLKKCRYLLAVLMLLSVFLSHYMLFPIIPLVLYYLSRDNKIKFWSVVFFLSVLVLFDGLYDTESRRFFMIEGMPLNFLWVCFSVIASLASVCLSKRIRWFGMAFWLCVCCCIAVTNYFNNSQNWKNREKNLNLYLHDELFPQVENRGKIFFYVSGPFLEEPRLQFMTGSYFTHSVKVGTIFNKEYYKEAFKRSQLLYKKSYDFESDVFYEYDKILNKITDSDTLKDRLSFLCGMNEITNVVADNDALPLIKEDSVEVGNGQRVFLYECSGN